jgi:NADH dehydrogenase
VVHISAIGADENSASSYARSKAMGEKLVLAARPDASVLRPSVVFGPEDDFFNRFASLAMFAPALPLVGGGHTRFQPVYVGDVAAAVAQAVEGHTKPGGIYELGGPEVRTFKELMQYVLQVTGRKRLLVPLPFALAEVKAWFLQLLPKPLLTVDQVKLLKSDTVVSDVAKHEGRTLEALGIAPTAMEAIAPTYLWRFRKTGQFKVKNGVT